MIVVLDSKGVEATLVLQHGADVIAQRSQIQEPRLHVRRIEVWKQQSVHAVRWFSVGFDWSDDCVTHQFYDS